MYITYADKKLNWDVLPTTLIKNYPYTDTSYKPLCEVKGYIYKGDLYLWVVAFEWDFLSDASTDEQSLINVHIGDQKNCVISCPHEGDVNIKCSSGLNVEVENHAISGEDNQGIYWGYELKISKNSLKTLGIKKTTVGSYINLNVTKTQFDKRKFHYGSLNPVADDFDIRKGQNNLPQLIIKY